MVVEIDKVHGGWVCREGDFGYGVRYTRGEGVGTDGLEISEGNFVIL